MYEVFLLLLQEILCRIKGESWKFGGMCVGVYARKQKRVKQEEKKKKEYKI